MVSQSPSGSMEIMQHRVLIHLLLRRCHFRHSDPLRVATIFLPYLRILTHKQNYLLQCQQVEPVVKSHKLYNHPVNPQIPANFCLQKIATRIPFLPEFKLWKVCDQTLLSWLQSNTAKEMITNVIRCKQLWQILDKIYTYFQTHRQ